MALSGHTPHPGAEPYLHCLQKEALALPTNTMASCALNRLAPLPWHCWSWQPAYFQEDCLSLAQERNVMSLCNEMGLRLSQKRHRIHIRRHHRQRARSTF